MTINFGTEFSVMRNYRKFSEIMNDALRIHSQPKVQYDQNLSTSRYKKFWKKLTTLKNSKKYILKNNNAKKILTNCQKNNCLFLYIKRIYWFFGIVEFLNFLRFWKFWKISATLRISDVFVPKFHDTREFPGRVNQRLHGYSLNSISKNKKIEKIYMDSEKSTKSFEMKKKDRSNKL